MQTYSQNISSNRKPPLDPSTYDRVGLELPTKTIQPQAQDGSSRVLTPNDEEIFNLRLWNIVEAMKDSSMTPEWKDILSDHTTAVWCSRIAKHIPNDVKLMLASSYPPTLAQLKSLSWSKTHNAVVFAWFSEVKKQDSAKKIPCVYIGTPTKYNGGVRHRKMNWLSESVEAHDEALKRKIKELGLNPKGEFRELLVVPFDNDFDGDEMDVRALVILAQRVLTVWLGASDERLKLDVKNKAPWHLKDIEYRGLVQGDPFKRPINGSNKAKKRRKNTTKTIVGVHFMWTSPNANYLQHKYGKQPGILCSNARDGTRRYTDQRRKCYRKIT